MLTACVTFLFPLSERPVYQYLQRAEGLLGRDYMWWSTHLFHLHLSLFHEASSKPLETEIRIWFSCIHTARCCCRSLLVPHFFPREKVCSSGNSGPPITEQNSGAGPLRRKEPRMDPYCLWGIVWVALQSLFQSLTRLKILTHFHIHVQICRVYTTSIQSNT